MIYQGFALTGDFTASLPISPAAIRFVWHGRRKKQFYCRVTKTAGEMNCAIAVAKTKDCCRLVLNARVYKLVVKQGDINRSYFCQLAVGQINNVVQTKEVNTKHHLCRDRDWPGHEDIVPFRFQMSHISNVPGLFIF